MESAVTDHALGAGLAVRHLASLGHRRVGVVLDEHSPTRPHVHRGWREAYREVNRRFAEAAAEVAAPGATVWVHDYQLLLVPRSNMSYQVAETAWNAAPQPLGTGRLMGCTTLKPSTWDALQDFIEDNRGNGPEAIP